MRTARGGGSTSARLRCWFGGLRRNSLELLHWIFLQGFFYWGCHNFLHALAESVYVGAGELRGVNRVVNEDRDFFWMQHPVAGLEELVGADHADRDDGNSESLRQVEDAFFEGLDMAVASARAFGEGEEADAGIEGGFGALRHDFQAFAAGRVWDGNISEAAHHPAVHGNFEMRFEFEAAQELRDGGVGHERVKEIHVIADEDAGAGGVEAWSAAHFEAGSGEAQDIAEENALGPVVFSWINYGAERDENCADYGEMNAADGPEDCGADGEVGLFHTITSSAAGRISSD